MSSSYKPRLLYIITKSDIGGAQGNVLDLIKAFLNDYEVHLAVGSFGGLTEAVIEIGVPVYKLPLTRQINMLADISGVQACIRLMNNLKPHIVHAHSSKAGVVARIAGRYCGVPTVFTAHGWGFSPGTPRLRQFIALITEQILASISSRIICVSESDRQLALKLCVGNYKTLTTIRCGIDDFPVTLAKPETQPPRLIMVARFNEQKDQATLLRSIAQLPDLVGHIDFIGSGPSLESCKALAADLKISHRVSFLGDRRDVPVLLSRAQIFVLATHYEGLPISILEAMRSGLPVIASNVNGIPEEVDHDITGLIVAPRDVSALANAIRLLLESPEMRQSMGIAARQKFEREFTLERMIQETQEVYHKLITENHSRT